MRLDIMMPYWGDPDLAKRAIASVQVQTSAEWTLTVLDDRYPDRTIQAHVKALGRADGRIRYLRNAKNLGPSRNYNQAVSLAKASYLVILGCDDELAPRFVERVGELVAKFPGVDLIQPGVEVIDETGQVYLPLADRVKRLIRPRASRPMRLAGEKLARSLMAGNWTYFPSLVWRTERLRGHTFRTDLNVVQDLAMIMDIVLDGGELVFDPEISFRYRRHRQSYSATTGHDGTKFGQELTLFRELEPRLSQAGWAAAARGARGHLFSRLNALSELPGALRRRDTASAARLWRFATTRDANG